MAPGDALQRPPLGRAEMVGHEQVTVLEKVGDALLGAADAGRPAAVGLGGPAPRQDGQLGRQVLADLGHGVQHRVGQFLDDVEAAELVGHAVEDQGQRRRVQGRAIGGDAFQPQAAGIQVRLEVLEEAGDVRGLGGMVQDAIAEAAEVVVIHQAQHAERAVIDLIDGDIAAEVLQRLVEILAFDARLAFFPPPPRPSSGWWRREQRRGGPATGARRRCGRASRPQPPGARRQRRRDGCNGCWAGPGRACPR